jgi:glycosyltransferase involved in cell wall biosynthesis
MKVAYDVGPLLDPPTGVGRYTMELGRALEARAVELVRYAVALRGSSDGIAARWRVPARVAQSAWRRLGWPSLEALVGAVDLVHATNFVLPSVARTPGVVTVHDLSFFREDTFPGGERLRELVPWSARRAAAVLVPSRAIAAEVEARLEVPRERIHVTHEGVSPVFFGATPLADAALARLGISRPYAVAVGTLEPRKNLARLLQAWSDVADSLRMWTLVLAGPPGWGPQLPPAAGVVPIGWVGDATLPGLLAGAEVFCYPSLYEGFGLPPLEAMAAGTPALVGGYPAAEEVLGDACMVVDPEDTSALGAGLERLAHDGRLRRRLSLAGKTRAAGYTWAGTARATTAAYAAAVEATRGSG